MRRTQLWLALPVALAVTAWAVWSEREELPLPEATPETPAASQSAEAPPEVAPAGPDTAHDLDAETQAASDTLVVELGASAGAEGDRVGGEALVVSAALGEGLEDGVEAAGASRGPLPDLIEDPIPAFLLSIGPENGDFEDDAEDLAPWLTDPEDTDRIVVDDGLLDRFDPPLGEIFDPFEGNHSALFLPTNGAEADVLSLIGEVTIEPRYDAAQLVWADFLRELATLAPGQEWRVEVRIAVAEGELPEPSELLFSVGPGGDPTPLWTLRSVSLDDYIGETIELLFTKEDVDPLGDPFFHTRLDAVGVYVGYDVVIELMPAEIDPVANEIITVTIFGSDDFDAESVDPETVTFGPAGIGPIDTRTEDTNGDARIDFVAEFESLASGLTAGNSEACITGGTDVGEGFEGCGTLVALVACGLGPELGLVLPALLWLRRRSRAVHRSLGEGRLS